MTPTPTPTTCALCGDRLDDGLFTVSSREWEAGQPVYCSESCAMRVYRQANPDASKGDIMVATIRVAWHRMPVPQAGTAPEWL